LPRLLDSPWATATPFLKNSAIFPTPKGELGVH